MILVDDSLISACCCDCRQSMLDSLPVHVRLTETYQVTDINRHRDHYSRTIFGRERTTLVDFRGRFSPTLQTCDKDRGL